MCTPLSNEVSCVRPCKVLAATLSGLLQVEVAKSVGKYVISVVCCAGEGSGGAGAGTEDHTGEEACSP